MALPQARVIIAHAYGPRFLELLVYQVLARYPGFWTRNVWVDLSFAAKLFAGSPYHAQFSWVIRQVGVDRLLFASDYPVDKPAEALAALEALGFDESELGAIAHDNAASLFGLSTATKET